jgi:hypothetical protein
MSFYLLQQTVSNLKFNAIILDLFMKLIGYLELITCNKNYLIKFGQQDPI